MAELRPIARLLVESVIGAEGPLPPGIRAASLDDVTAAAFAHRVRPAVLRRLRLAPDAPTLAAPLDGLRHLQLLRHMQAASDLKAIDALFKPLGVRWVVAKGPVLADTIWPHADMREYSDLDIFVHPADFSTALAALVGGGFRYVDRNWPEIRRQGRAELAMVGPSGLALDLHWAVAVSKAARRAFRCDLSAMLDRARTVTLGSGQLVPTFDAIDTLLHVAHHAAQSGANRLVWIADVLHAGHAAGVDWVELEQRSSRAGMTITSAIVLARVERVFGVELPLPTRLRRAAQRSVPGRMALRRDQVRPFPGLPGDPALSGVEYSSARRNDVLSVLAAVTQLIGVRFTERRINRRGPDANPLDLDVPDDTAKSAYLAGVAREGRGRRN